MGFFDNLFGGTPQSKLFQSVESRYERIVQDSMRRNPDPFLGAMQCYHDVLSASDILKREYSQKSEFSSLSKSEINKVIDDVQHKMLKKYFENFN
jgi:hypothetical protein